MLIHELSSAVQRDRERDLRVVLDGRRLLAVGRGRVHHGLLSRVRAILRPSGPPRTPRVPPRTDPTRA